MFGVERPSGLPIEGDRVTVMKVVISTVTVEVARPEAKPKKASSKAAKKNLNFMTVCHERGFVKEGCEEEFAKGFLWRVLDG